MIARFIGIGLAGLCLGITGARAQTPPAAATDVLCTVLRASLNFGSIRPMNVSFQDGVGELEIQCRNAGTVQRSVAIVVALDWVESGAVFQMPNVTSRSNIPVRFYADAARSRELLLRGRGLGGIQAAITVGPKEQRSLVVPIYARAYVSRTTSVGNYQQSLPVVVTYEAM